MPPQLCWEGAQEARALRLGGRRATEQAGSLLGAWPGPCHSGNKGTGGAEGLPRPTAHACSVTAKPQHYRQDGKQHLGQLKEKFPMTLKSSIVLKRNKVFFLVTKAKPVNT